jgi:DNA-binding transcriptional LysR family regulator
MYSLPALRYAELAARLKSFSAAARECGVSQPSVSSAVADLEKALAAELFQRGGRQLELTRYGARLLPRISAVLSAVEALQSETLELASTARSELRIGFTPLAGAARVALLIDPYRRQHADTRVLFFESGVADLEQRLEAGQLDLIVGCGFSKRRSQKRLRLLQDPLVLCSTTALPTAGAGISLEAASRDRLLLTQDLCGLATATAALFEAAGLVVDAYPGRAMSYGALEDWVELGLGSAVIPLHHVRNRAHARTLTDAQGAALSLSLEARWKPRLAAAEHAAQFLAYLHRVVPPLASGLVR